jgi:peptidoglycan-associated lipoprotein
VLQANAGMRIRIAGHTDEQGSDEYNLALGQRRAAAAKRYLTQHDVDAGRIEIARFGEEQPTCAESEERCWARNRRAEFTITVGTVATAPR